MPIARPILWAQCLALPMTQNPIMSRYVAQVIIMFFAGEGDEQIKRGSQALVTKGELNGVTSHTFTHGLTSPATVAATIRRLPRPWRLYLNSHGLAEDQSIAWLRAPEVARYLAACGLADNPPHVISVLTCQGALGKYQSSERFETRICQSSFTSQLHKTLAAYGIRVLMYGRMLDVLISTKRYPGKKYAGSPVAVRAPDTKYHSKVMYFWEGETWQCRFCDAEARFAESSKR